MPKKEERKLLSKKRTRLISFALPIVAFAVSFICAYMAVAPKSYDIAIGEPSPATVFAPEDIVDAAATNLLRENARANANEVFAIDGAEVERLVSGASAFIDKLAEVRASAYAEISPDGATEIIWSEALGSEKIASLCAMSAPPLESDMLMGILEATAPQLQTLRDVVMSKLNIALEAGLAADAVNGVRSSCMREINALSGLNAGLKSIAQLVFDEYMLPTLVRDVEGTEAAMETAASAITPVIIKKGSVIAEHGNIITASQYAILDSLGLVTSGEKNTALGFGMFFALFLAFSAFVLFLYIYKKEVLFDLKKMMIISILIILSSGLGLLGTRVDARLDPALIAIMLSALLVGERTALALTGVMAMIFALMAGDAGEAFASTGAMAVFATTVSEGVFCVFALRRTQSRSAIIAAGALGGGAAAVCSTAFELMAGGDIISILIAIAWAMGSAMLCTLLVTGSLSVWENLFDVATAPRLNELSNTNHPLMRQLMTEAPGTYQHSIMTAALAEGAALRIGADPLLARVGGYFHDVGKLRRPLYFKENQKNGENIHDTLPPLESAQTIIAHQKDGVFLLTKAKLPSAVIRICGEHHGNSLMTYFFAKAKQADPNVAQKGFRYPGNRPSSKESAIVMLADSCEAAVRSLGDTDSAAVEQMVHKIIWSKLDKDDNMMSIAPLTIAEFTDIEKSFLKTFGGLMHDRIEYPDMEAK